MNLLQIFSSNDPGGPARYVEGIARDLTARGHNVHVACQAGSRIAKWLPTEQRLELKFTSALKRFGVAIQLARFIRHQEIDIIQAHSDRDYAVAIIARKFARRGTVLFTRHELRLPSSSRYNRWLWSQADHIAVVVRSMITRLSHHLEIAPERFSILPGWLDLERYAVDVDPAELPVETPHCVGMIGRIVPGMGQDIFVRAAKLVLTERKDITFLIAGENALSDEAYLASLMSSVGNDLNIRFFPWQDDPRPIFAALTALAVPSRDEGFPRFLLEGIAAGVPVITFKGPGSGEIVVHNETGLLIPAEDPRALAAAIQYAVDNENRRASWAIAAHMIIEAQYATEPAVKRFETVLKTLSTPAA